MKLYCKDFDEERCVYEDNRRYCNLRIVEEMCLYVQKREPYKSSICGASLSFEQYVTKFEWLMIKELKEKKQ